MTNTEITRAGKIIERLETTLKRIQEHEHEAKEDEWKQWLAPWLRQEVAVAKALAQEQIANFQLIHQTGCGDSSFIDAAILAKNKAESLLATLNQQIAQARGSKGGDE